MVPKWTRLLFVVAAVYDFGLGVLYLLAWRWIFAWCGIAPPNHPSYVQFAAATIAIFGIGFGMVAAAPQRNRDIIKLGILFKLAFGGMVVRYLFSEPVAPMWVAYGFCDLVFAAAFAVALRAIPPGGYTSSVATADSGTS